MGNLEQDVLCDESIKPATYCRYVDAIYVVVRDEEQLLCLKHRMEQRSVLKFTYELNVERTIPFLDVLVENQDGNYVTKVYRKPTDKGQCLNARSECPSQYKTSVIRGAIRRAHRICSSWQLFDEELGRSKQILINNGYSNSEFDQEVGIFLQQIHRKDEKDKKSDEKKRIKVYYKNQMTDAYKVDERVLKDIIKRNTKCSQENIDLTLCIYYKNQKTSNLLMRNNLNPNKELKCTNVIYKFTCPHEDCLLRSNVTYVGNTATTFSRRLTMHLANGAIKHHMASEHNTILTRDQLTENTAIVKRVPDINRLQIAEAILIMITKPIINRQDTGLSGTLRLFSELHSRSTIHDQDLSAPSSVRNETQPENIFSQSAASNSRNLDTTRYTLRSQTRLH